MDLISTIFHDDIKQMLRPVFSSGCVSGFSHSRIFPDGSRAEVWSNPSALENAFMKTNYLTRKHAPTLYDKNDKFIFLKDKVLEFDATTRSNYEKHLSEQAELFNLDNMLMVNLDTSFCREFYIFYGHKGLAKTKTYFLNNLEHLQGIISDYNRKAAKIIKLAEEERIVKPWLQKCKIKLTKKEIEIAQLITYGKTSAQIADLLGNKKRTIDNYTEVLKEKYCCDSKSGLIQCLRQDGDLFS